MFALFALLFEFETWEKIFVDLVPRLSGLSPHHPHWTTRPYTLELTARNLLFLYGRKSGQGWLEQSS
ncbi:hypothetical protein H924_07070 [Corynebacterium callunae DSM 20147]|uniref:Uncharacterized protein n=1 Tax=Corynebacterium callunae DSM 20147 TaxID=1121353 RepID=M1TRC7_9CORY|nr:hypothetical protein H924_07070 [Corynebacterium callunae DSM 20147]